jgi:hypothetical protein
VTLAFSGRKTVPLIASLALVTAFSITAISASAETISNANASLSWKLVAGHSPVDAYFKMKVTPPKLDPSTTGKLPPSDLAVTVTIARDGAVYCTRQCNFPGAGSLNLGPCNFHAPFDGAGDYVFTASFTDKNLGTLVAQATIDPLLEPSWK